MCDQRMDGAVFLQRNTVYSAAYCRKVRDWPKEGIYLYFFNESLCMLLLGARLFETG